MNNKIREKKLEEYAKAQAMRIPEISNSMAITFVTLAEKGDIDEVTAGEHIELFTAWEAGVSYTQGNIRRYGDKLYKCLQTHTAQEDWTPDASPALWKNIADPAEEWPKWSQPIGAGDTYTKGDKVSHNSKHWVSNTDNNVWEPGVYGWDEKNDNETSNI